MGEKGSTTALFCRRFDTASPITEKDTTKPRYTSSFILIDSLLVALQYLSLYSDNDVGDAVGGDAVGGDVGYCSNPSNDEYNGTILALAATSTFAPTI